VAQHDQQVEEEIMATAICDTMGMSMEELSGILENVFFSHDVDGNGVLDQSEFVKCVVELGTKLNIDKRLGSEIFRAVDVNGDGLIEWKEFVGPAVRIIHSSVAEDIAQEIEIAEEAKIIRRQTAEDQAPPIHYILPMLCFALHVVVVVVVVVGGVQSVSCATLLCYHLRMLRAILFF